jgi:hypothetical protein
MHRGLRSPHLRARLSCWASLANRHYFIVVHLLHLKICAIRFVWTLPYVWRWIIWFVNSNFIPL